METKEIAKVIKEAQKLREESFDFIQYENAVDLHGGLYVDMHQFYNLTVEESVSDAVENSQIDEEIGYLIHLLLKRSWNDVGNWAFDILSVSE